MLINFFLVSIGKRTEKRVFMLGDRKKKGIKRYVFLGLGVAIFLYLLFVDFYFIPQGHYDKQLGNGVFEDFVVNQIPDTQTFMHSDLILTEAVLSIVKNYYVDSHRISNAQLIDAILSSLSASLDLKVKRFQGVLLVELDGYSVELEVRKNMISDQIIQNLTSLGRLIEKSDSYNKLVAKNPRKEGLVFVLHSLLTALDAHSGLLSADSYKELRQGTEGTFGGLGVLVGMRDQLLTVIKPLPRSPAERSGILTKDRILSIDGRDTYGYSLNDLVEIMRGPPGTKVRLSVLREDALSVRDVQIQREIIEVDSVFGKIYEKSYGNLLSLTIESFTSRTSNEIINIINVLKDEGKSFSGVILDLRSNPGGLLDQAVKVADIFLSQGIVVTTKGRNTEVEVAYNHEETDINCPVIVLINHESASASEIVAGALQDHDRAIVIGQPSFGKGSVQTIFELPKDRALKLTIARYYTPSGISIQNIGIVPDIWVQPIFNRSTNKNLMGEYRYKNEGFLSNHLLAGKGFQEQAYSRKTLFKGYYYYENHGDFEENKGKDYEFSLSEEIFKKLYQVYESGVPHETNRASHWLSIAGEEIKDTVSKWNSVVHSSLKNSHEIDWRSYNGKDIANALSFNNENKIRKNIKPGDVLAIPYSIKNVKRYPIGQVSVFVRSSKVDFDTIEQLVGRIDSLEKYQGKIEVHIPTYLKKGNIDLELGVAVGGRVNTGLTKKINIDVNERKIPEIGLEVDLVSEDGGTISGSLEANENAKVAVKIENNSGIGASGLVVKILNLTGKQLLLNRNEIKVNFLGPHQEKIVYFEIKGSEILMSKNIDLGVLIESNDFNFPIRKKATIGGIPSPEFVKQNIIRH